MKTPSKEGVRRKREKTNQVEARKQKRTEQTKQRKGQEQENSPNPKSPNYRKSNPISPIGAMWNQ